ncbi:MAG: YqgE/AlgH family protein [Nitrospira sp.]|nr:YqgE/AlgH family protein [Nitrospira sp.]
MKKLVTTLGLCVWIVIGFQDEAVLQQSPVASLRQGVLLFSIPELRDPNFSQTVVLLINYEKEGAMGVIINKPTEISLDEALPDVEGIQGQSLPVFFGGPVDRNHMIVLLRTNKPPKNTLRVFKDVYFTGSKDVLLETLKKHDSHEKVRVYAGYAGWAAGQLEHEVSRGDWVISNADPDMIFVEDPSKIWPQIFNLQEEIEIRNPPSHEPPESHEDIHYPSA